MPVSFINQKNNILAGSWDNQTDNPPLLSELLWWSHFTSVSPAVQMGYDTSFYGRFLGCRVKCWYMRRKHCVYLNALTLVYSICLHCLFLTVVLVCLIQRCGTTKGISSIYLHVYVCVLFTRIKVCDEGSLVRCFRFKMKCCKQTAKLMKESVLLFMFYTT